MTNSSKTKHIGGADFDPETYRVSRRGHEPARLRPQTSRVLALLVNNAGNTISKDDLINAVWRDTHVTDDSLVQCISEIRKALGPKDARLLQTIPKKGYRLEITARDAKPVKRRKAARGISAIVLVLAGALIYFLWPRAGNAPVTQSIAVLPFTNMSGAEDQAYFSDGISEDIIVGLSKISDLRVVSRGAAFAVARATDDTLEIAKTLNVEYILEGSVRRQGGNLRVSAALVDGKTGVNVWAERYEGSTDDIFAFQDDLLVGLLRTLAVRMSRQERARLGVFGTRNVAAHDAYWQGRALESKFTQQTNADAEIAFKQALSFDPEFAGAYAHLAQIYSYRVENHWTDWPEATIEAAFSAAQKAVELDETLSFAHFSLGRLYSRSFAPDAAKATAAFERAIEIDPNYIGAKVFLANVFIFNGQAQKALPLIADAIDRHPFPPFWYFQAEGMAQYFLGNYDGAEAALVQAREQSPTAPFPYRFLIATYGQLGQIDDAEWTVIEYESLGRRATITALMETASIQDAAYRDVFREGFEKAGLSLD